MKSRFSLPIALRWTRHEIAYLAIFTLPLALAIGGCRVGPKYSPPTVALAPFHNPPSLGSGANAPAPPSLETWWLGFRDPDLNRIVDRALHQNLDLAAAVTRVTQARAISREMGALNKPQANLSVQDTALHQSLESPFGKLGSPTPGYDRNQNYYDLGIAATWEIDLFGQLKNGAIASSDEAEAANAAQAGTRISIIADAADAYLQVRGDQQRIAYTIEQIDKDEHLVTLVRQRFDAGVATDREVAQAEALLQQAKASLPLLRIDRETELNRLDVLMGAQPGTYAKELSEPKPIPEIPAIEGYDNPVDFLRRRPDIVAAERRVAASNARIGVALAGYYPSISLSALLGAEAVAPGHLFQDVAFQPQSLVGLRWRIFDFGRVSAEVKQARGANAEALNAYRQTVLHAAEDVENSFVTLSEFETRQQEIIREVDALTRVRDRSQEAYLAGAIPLTDVLDADRQLLLAQDELAQMRAAVAQSAVGSFRALGGGWAS
jgi:NodT family efflux transporter outer membrane factor (OMF) lipoprotein